MATIRPPYQTMPITIAVRSITQKTYGHLHCLECGRSFLDIADKVAVVIDGSTPV